MTYDNVPIGDGDSYSFMQNLPPVIKVQGTTAGYMAWFVSGTTGIQQGECAYGKTKQEAIHNLYNAQLKDSHDTNLNLKCHHPRWGRCISYT